MAKILVIIDDRGIRHLLDSLLPRKGYVGRQERPDVIVLDLNMPEMDGLTVLRHVRSLNIQQPVIMYSGAWAPKTEQQIRALGITEMVKKDCSLDHLEQALQRALMSPGPGGEGVLPQGRRLSLSGHPHQGRQKFEDGGQQRD